MSLSGVLMQKGAPVVFSHTIPGTVDPNTDMGTGATIVTVTGRVMEIDGDPDLYKALSLIESDNPTLLFRPDVRGVIPVLGSTVVWGGQLFTVRNIKRLAMAGTATAARLVVSR